MTLEQVAKDYQKQTSLILFMQQSPGEYKDELNRAYRKQNILWVEHYLPLINKQKKVA